MSTAEWGLFLSHRPGWSAWVQGTIDRLSDGRSVSSGRCMSCLRQGKPSPWAYTKNSDGACCNLYGPTQSSPLSQSVEDDHKWQAGGGVLRKTRPLILGLLVLKLISSTTVSVGMPTHEEKYLDVIQPLVYSLTPWRSISQNVLTGVLAPFRKVWIGTCTFRSCCPHRQKQLFVTLMLLCFWYWK